MKIVVFLKYLGNSQFEINQKKNHALILKKLERVHLQEKDEPTLTQNKMKHFNEHYWCQLIGKESSKLHKIYHVRDVILTKPILDCIFDMSSNIFDEISKGDANHAYHSRVFNF